MINGQSGVKCQIRSTVIILRTQNPAGKIPAGAKL